MIDLVKTISQLSLVNDREEGLIMVYVIVLNVCDFFTIVTCDFLRFLFIYVVGFKL